MPFFRLRLTLLLGFLVTSSAWAQTLNTNPTSLKWYYLNTEHFRIIFPENNDSLAQHTANLMETLYEPVNESLGANPKPISIILQNQTTISNGFVSYQPRRSEFFMAPPQDYNFVGTNDWLSLLAVHEFRHVSQFASAHYGLNRINYWLGGEAGFGGFSFLVMPSWFWEGDAVGIETAFTPLGRGRIPEFNMAFRTTLLERGGWNYSKQYLRSYKHFVPNHYVTGYYMTSYVREKTGDRHIWEKIENEAVALPYVPFRIGTAMKGYTGTNMNNTYKEMVESMRQRWQEQVEGLEFTEATAINERREKRAVYTNYRFPQVLSNGWVVTQKSGLGDIPQLVYFDEAGKEHKIRPMGIVSSSEQLTEGGGILCWIEHEFHPRWTAKDYAVIRLYNVATQKLTRLTKKSRYLAAAIDPQGRKVAGLSVDTEGRQVFEIISIQSGEVEQRHPLAPGQQAAMPRWTDEGLVYLLTEARGKKSLQRWNPKTKQRETLLAASNENIGYPVPWEDYILYNSPYSGIDNIYAVDTRSGARYQVTSRKYGAFNPEPSRSGDTLYFNDYTFYGHDLAAMPLDPERWTPLDEVAVRIDDTYEVWVEQEAEHLDVLDEVPDSIYYRSDWEGFARSFNPYAWAFGAGNGSTDNLVGVYVQDELSTVNAGITYGYDPTENTSRVGINASLQGLFPIFDINYSQGGRYVTTPPDSNNIRDTARFRERQVGLSVRLPFTLTRSHMLQQGSVEVGVNNIAIQDFVGNFRTLGIVGPPYDVVNTFNYRLDYTWQRRQAQRDLAPRYGISTRFQAFHTPLNGNGLFGWLAGNTSQIWLPGIGKHHTLQLRGSFQRQYLPRSASLGPAEQNIYTFRSPFGGTLRGYQFFSAEQMTLFSIRYGLPLAYPDWAIWHLLYIQRISATAFYDQGTFVTSVDGQNFSWTQRSAGLDLNFDLNGMRYLPQFNVGVRGGYAFDSSQPYFVSLLMNGSALQTFNFLK